MINKGQTKLSSYSNTSDIEVYSGIDLFKVFAAILVVFIHSNIAKNEEFSNVIVLCFSGIAVPFFFMVSGFFFYKKLSNVKDEKSFIIFYEKKLLFLYFFWQLVNLPMTINAYIIKYPDSSVIKYVLLIFRSIFLCGNGVTWYILSMSEAAFIIYLVHKFFKDKAKIKIILFLIVIGFSFLLCYDSFKNLLISTPYSYVNKLFYVLFSWSNNFIMKAVPFMGIGCIIYFLNLRIPLSLATVALALLSVFSLAVYCFKINDILNIDFYVILNIPLTICYFFISLEINLNIKSEISQILRGISSTIYFLHTYILYYVLDKFLGYEFSCVLKVLISVTCLTVVYFLIRKSNLKILKKVLNLK